MFFQWRFHQRRESTMSKRIMILCRDVRLHSHRRLHDNLYPWGGLGVELNGFEWIWAELSLEIKARDCDCETLKKPPSRNESHNEISHWQFLAELTSISILYRESDILFSLLLYV